MKKIFALLLAVLLLAVTVSAQTSFVLDHSGVLTMTDKEALESKFSECYTQYDFTIAAALVDSFGEKTAAEYAADCYSINGYENDGILLLICENEGQWHIYTSGLCASVITDADAAQIGAAIMDDLQAGDYYSAIKTFGDMSMEPVSKEVSAQKAAAELARSSQKTYVLLGLLGGLIVGVLVVVLLARKAKAPRRASAPAPVEEDENKET